MQLLEGSDSIRCAYHITYNPMDYPKMVTDRLTSWDTLLCRPMIETFTTNSTSWDHCIPVAASSELATHLTAMKQIKAAEDPNQKAIYLLFSVWNLLPIFWGKNAAKHDNFIYHCWVDVETSIWHFRSRMDVSKDEWDYFTIVELFSFHQDELLEPSSGIFFEDWSFDLDLDDCIFFSKEDAEKNFQENHQERSAIASFDDYVQRSDKNHLLRPQRDKSDKRMTDIADDDESACQLEDYEWEDQHKEDSHSPSVDISNFY